MFECPYDYSILLLGLAYLSLVLIFLFQSFRVLCDEEFRLKLRKQKQFFFLACIHVTCRTGYFFWELEQKRSADCVVTLPTGSSERDMVDTFESILGTVPAAIFVTTFSITLRTFARIYHHATLQELRRYRYFSIALWIVNFILYSVMIAAQIAPNGKVRDGLTLSMIVVVCCAELFIAWTLLFYSGLLYATAPSSVLPLLCASICCFVCFSAKAVFLLSFEFIFDGTYPTSMYLLYYVVSEILPFYSMLLIELVGRERTTAKEYSILQETERASSNATVNPSN